MAFRTFLRRRFVEQNLFPSHFPERFVAKVTFHTGVAALKRELRPFVVVKCRRHPSHGVVAVAARGLSRLGHKLSAMRVEMAFLTSLWCPLELGLFGSDERFVTSATAYRTVRAQQREFRFAMVESVYIHPRPGVVTGFAAEYGSIRPAPCHAVLEFAVMRIVMASRATAVLELKRQNLVCPVSHFRLVAVVARDANVSAA